MSKNLRMFLYVLISHMLITFINFLLLCLELTLSDSPITEHFPGNLDIDMMIWMLIAISAVFTVFSYTAVGMQVQRTDNTVFNVAMVLLPSVFTYAGCVIMGLTSRTWLELSAMFLDSLFGIFVLYLYDSAVKYVIAICPSICMSIGYIIKLVHKKQNGKAANKT